MEKEQGLVVSQDSKALTANDIRAQVNLIQEVMKDVMQGPSKENPEGIHYGIIPGCKKPSLYKAGAEKLSMVFRLRPIMNNNGDIIIEKLDAGHREVTVFCHIFNMAGIELATGIGSCSTKESKYRYRGGEKKSIGQPVPKEYWNLKKAGKRSEAQETIGGEGFGVAKIEGNWEICEIGEKMENPDIADTYNTVLKIGKKRAYIDGILSATGASDIFTQDIEDFATETISPEKVTESKPKVAEPQQKTTSKEAPKAEGEPMSSEKQQKAIHTIANKRWGEDADEKLNTKMMTDYAVDSTTKLTMEQASDLINWFNENKDNDE